MKMNLIKEWLKELNENIDKNEKIIIFSQWDELLHKVGSILKSNDINIVYCDRSVYQKKKSIQSFCNDPNVNVIMLSSKNCASGINLMIASKIIFLEPIYGSKDYRQNIESQAIGRVDRLGQKHPIDIYYFIIKDTVEEEVYNNIIEYDN
jgi:SNF2 family DNA or RNA helicase